jgi:hypothetical protein
MCQTLQTDPLYAPDFVFLGQISIFVIGVDSACAYGEAIGDLLTKNLPWDLVTRLWGLIMGQW